MSIIWYITHLIEHSEKHCVTDTSPMITLLFWRSKPELLLSPRRCLLTAAPRSSYFTGSQRRRATSPSWLIRDNETHRLASSAGDLRGGSRVHCRPPAHRPRTHRPAPRRMSAFWTFGHFGQQRGGRQDLVELLAFWAAVPEPRTLAVKSWGGFLTFCRQTYGGLTDFKVVLWVFVKFTGE